MDQSAQCASIHPLPLFKSPKRQKQSKNMELRTVTNTWSCIAESLLWNGLGFPRKGQISMTPPQLLQHYIYFFFFRYWEFAEPTDGRKGRLDGDGWIPAQREYGGGKQASQQQHRGGEKATKSIRCHLETLHQRREILQHAMEQTYRRGDRSHSWVWVISRW